MILVSGANGFLGSALLAQLRVKCVPVRAAVRTATNPNQIVVGDINSSTNWQSALENIDTVIHTAAHVHVMKREGKNTLGLFRETNTEGTLNLARQAAKANVKRFIFISSIKVNGESTLPGKAFTADDKPEPEDPYGISKWEAETKLQQLAAESELEVVIIRPPLIYGPGVKGNFMRLIRWVDSGIPLPLGAVKNKRSLVALDNLVGLILTCIDHPAAANQIFLAGDGEDLSTTELLQRIGRIMDRRIRLIPFPTGLLTFAASVLGQRAIAQRLCGSLQVDISKARSLLGWKPSVPVDEGLRKVVEDFKSVQ